MLWQNGSYSRLPVGVPLLALRLPTLGEAGWLRAERQYGRRWPALRDD